MEATLLVLVHSFKLIPFWLGMYSSSLENRVYIFYKGEGSFLEEADISERLASDDLLQEASYSVRTDECLFADLTLVD